MVTYSLYVAYSLYVSYRVYVGPTPPSQGRAKRGLRQSHIPLQKIPVCQGQGRPSGTPVLGSSVTKCYSKRPLVGIFAHYRNVLPLTSLFYRLKWPQNGPVRLCLTHRSA